VFREGLTNVILHSRARHCLILITSTNESACVEVNNDGYPRENSMANRTGRGLSGLAERVAKQSGHLEAGPQSMGGVPGFRLFVDIPNKEGVSMEVR